MAAKNNKRRGLLFIVIICVAVYFIFFWNQDNNKDDLIDADKSIDIVQVTIPDGAVDCSYDIECLKKNAKENTPSIGLAEEEPTPYTMSELKKYKIRGEEPPERTAPLWSHYVKECNEDICTVIIKMERIPSETPNYITDIMKKFNEMECRVNIDDLGNIPEDKSTCSGAFLEGLEIIEKYSNN